MEKTNGLTALKVHSGSLGTRVLAGAGIALVVILIFILPVKTPKPEWGSLWMIRPLLVVPLAGATGGLCYHFMDYLRYRGGWRKPVAIALSLLIYVVGLWMGIVLGLAGTLWD